MSPRKTTILALLMAAGPAGMADAQEAPFSQIYLNAVPGWETQRDPSRLAPPSFSLPPPAESPSAGATIGWRPMESLRLELEFLRQNSNGELLSGLDSLGKPVDSHSLMANALVDFKVSDWLTPYVGVGLGVTRLQPEGLRADMPHFNLDQDVIAYQGIAGISMPFTESFSLFADTRLIRSQEFGLAPSMPAEGHLQSWTALAGFRFTFGGR